MRIAARHRIPIVWLDRMDDPGLAEIRAFKPDLLITCGFSIILKKKLLALPAIGCINIHSSLLPKHRGPCPFNYAILAGDSETGVTFHVTEEAIDSGNILDQVRIPLVSTDTGLTVYRKACEAARAHVLAVVDAIEQDGLRGVPQDRSQATYDKKLTAEDATIRWDRSAVELERLVRGCYPTMPVRFQHRGTTVYVLRASSDPRHVDAPPGTVLSDSPLRVATSEGAFTIRAAGTRFPVPWMWPAPWNRPNVGDRLE